MAHAVATGVAISLVCCFVAWLLRPKPSRKLQRKPSMKDECAHWLVTKVRSLGGSGIRGLKRTDSRLVRRASCPLIGNRSASPQLRRRHSCDDSFFARTLDRSPSSSTLSESQPNLNLRLPIVTVVLAICMALMKVPSIRTRFRSELHVFALTMTCYLLVLLLQKPTSQRKASKKEQTVHWLMSTIWSFKGSGLRGLKRSDSRLVRRASQPLVGSGSTLLASPSKGLKSDAYDNDDASTSAGSDIGSPISSPSASPMSSPSRLVLSGFGNDVPGHQL